jgi:2-amino-4-hydroxy-6-hydroxymethyldihydropteridine diphosphokinase
LSAIVAYLGLGSNLGDPVRQLQAAISALAELPSTRLLRQSALYRCAPWGIVDQPEFVNAVVEIETSLTPQALLAGMLDIEQRAGRVRDAMRWGPRLIDLDLLVYGDRVISEGGLDVPHPRIGERAFVLVPLAELEPALQVPGQGVALAMLSAIDASNCVRIVE